MVWFGMPHEETAAAGVQGIGRAQRIAADDPARLQDRLAGRYEYVERLCLEDQQRLQPGEAPGCLVAPPGAVRFVDAHELGRRLAARYHPRGSGIENVQIVQSARAAEHTQPPAEHVHELGGARRCRKRFGFGVADVGAGLGEFRHELSAQRHIDVRRRVLHHHLDRGRNIADREVVIPQRRPGHRRNSGRRRHDRRGSGLRGVAGENARARGVVRADPDEHPRVARHGAQHRVRDLQPLLG